MKYVDIKKIDPKNATPDEYRCLAAYLNGGGNTSIPCEPMTTGMDYNDNDRYDLVSLVERDLKMYRANRVAHHVAVYEKILNGMNSLMSTDYYKNNVETGKRGIGVEEALATSRAKFGISDNSKKINKAMNKVDRYLEDNKNRQVQEREKQAKRLREKKQQDKEKLEEILENLRVNRNLARESILETQIERKERLSRLQKENLLKKNPYDLS